VDTDWNLHGCAAIEALRSGVVNQHVARYITYGRDAEITSLERGVTQVPQGSCQVVIGRYGVGKTHLCEVLTSRLETKGYAVARIELGSSSGRAENPDAILASVCRSLSLRIPSVHICGASDMACWVRAVKKPLDTWGWERTYLKQLYARLPGRKNIIQRYNSIREEFAALCQTDDFTSFLVRDVPSSMTACNLAVSRINQLAHTLQGVGVKGLVLLLDEAERSNWAYDTYRKDRARDMMLGLALASANVDTSHLKHYGNDSFYPYRPLDPSRVHSIFWFTHPYGLATEINQYLERPALDLAPLGKHALKRIVRKVEDLHCSTYCWPAGRLNLDEFADSTWENGTRAMIRQLVAALDGARFHSDG